MLMQDRAGNVDAGSLGLTVLNIKGPVGCRPAPNLDHPVMLPDGRLLLCCQLYSMEEIIGNIVDQTWDEIYNDAPLADIRKRMNDGEIVCRSCCYAERKWGLKWEIVGRFSDSG